MSRKKSKWKNDGFISKIKNLISSMFNTPNLKQLQPDAYELMRLIWRPDTGHGYYALKMMGNTFDWKYTYRVVHTTKKEIGIYIIIWFYLSKFKLYK